MADTSQFDFSAERIMAGGEIARRNWERLEEHTVAEWSGDLDATMAVHPTAAEELVTMRTRAARYER